MKWQKCTDVVVCDVKNLTICNTTLGSHGSQTVTLQRDSTLSTLLFWGTYLPTYTANRENPSTLPDIGEDTDCWFLRRN